MVVFLQTRSVTPINDYINFKRRTVDYHVSRFFKKSLKLGFDNIFISMPKRARL